MDKVEWDVVLGSLAMAALNELVITVRHRIGWCDGRISGFRRLTHPVTCRVCLEEDRQRRAAAFYAAWDSVGLGYVGR